MTPELRTKALVKLAYFGAAAVPGMQQFTVPPLTVGQVMYNANALGSPMSMHEKRIFMDKVVNSGLNVNDPAKNLIRAGIGALAGNFIANALGLGPFKRGIATAIGANYGYRH